MVQVAIRASLYSQSNDDDGEIVKLRTSHLKGLYVMWLFGIMISCTCFVIETAVHRNIKRTELVA